MKKNYILFVMLLAFSSLSAQITFTNDNLAPAGVTFTLSTDTLVSATITPGEAGTNKTWDFTSLVAHTEDQIAFMLPAWTPYPDAFPNANFAAFSSGDGDAYAFFNRSDDEFSAIGLVGSYDEFGLFEVALQPKEIYLDFPVQYQDNREEDFYFEVNLGNIMDPFDSIRFKQSTHKVSLVDAWGNMTLALGSYEVLRVKEDRVVRDSVWGKTFGFWSLLSAESDSYTDYQWITNDPAIGYTLVDMDYDEQSQTVNSVDFMNTFPVGVKEEKISVFKIFPNPATDVINISLDNNTKVEISIYNSQSQLLINSSLNNGTEINISELSSGLYFFNVINEKGEILETGKFIKK